MGFKLLAQKKSAFWDTFEQALPSIGNIFNCAFKDLIYSMLSFHKNQRLSIQDIKDHPWMQERVATQDEIFNYMSQRIESGCSSEASNNSESVSSQNSEMNIDKVTSS